MKKHIFMLCLLALLSLCIVSCDSAKTTEPIPNSPSGITEQSSPEQAEKDPSAPFPSTKKSERPTEEPSLSPVPSEEPSPTKEEPTPSASKEEPTPPPSDEEPTPTPSPEECTHTFGDWQTVTQATCQKEGQRERTCTLCGEKEEEPTAKTAHTEVTLPAVAASCSKTGLSAGTQCSVCNTVLQKQEIIPVKDHTAVTDKAVAATCTKTGLSEGSHCSVCNKVLKKQETVPAKDHTPVTDKAVAATCTKTGLSEGSHCSACNKVLKKQETVAVKAHEYQNGTCKTCGALKESEGLEFTETTGGYALSGMGTCTDKVIVIPSSHNGKPVVRISNKALETDERIEKIIIPDSVEVLENYAISPRYFVYIEVGANAKAENYAFNISSSACAEIYNRSKYALSSNAVSQGAFVNIYTPASGKSTVEQTDEGYVFVTVKGKAYLADYRGSSKEPVLPALYNGKSYEIAAFAFSETDIDSVKMQDGVTAIYQCAFENSAVSSITFSQKLTKIGHACFMNCKNLKEVVLPDSVIEIGTQCFYESGIQTATIGKNLKTAGHGMFHYCPNPDTLYYNATDCDIDGLEGFKKLVIGKNVKTISAKFMASSKLEEIVIEKGSCLEYIGGSAFAGSAISSITIPETVKTLGNAFENCKNLKTIQFNAINCTAFQTFAERSELTVTVGAKVKTLPANLFKNCTFASFVFEENSACTKIEKGFTNYAISNVTIPKTVKELNLSGFDPLTVKLEEGNPYYLYIDYCLIRKEDHTLVNALHKDFVIPTDGSVTRIAKCAFTGGDITSIYIPDVITEIEEGAFNNCINLKSLSLPFIGTSRENSCMLAVLFGRDRYYGAVEVLSGVAGTPSAVYYYVPATLRKLTFRGETLQSNALTGFEKITTLKLSTSVQSVGKDLLKPCALYLKEIHYEGSEEAFDALNANSWLYYTDEDTVFVYNAEIH